MTPRFATPPLLAPHRRWEAAPTLLGAVVLILITVTTPVSHLAWLAGVALALAAAMQRAGVRWRVVGRRVLRLSPFVGGVAVASAWSDAPTMDWRVTALRGTLSLTTVVVLTETTTLPEMLEVLRRIRVPALLLTTLALMDRYVFVLADETERMRRARLSRTFRSDRSLAWWMAASVVGQLFVRASERAERVYDAMCARGWR